jgi:hypothetical protein
MTKAAPEGIPGDVCRYFEQQALELIALGFKRYSADAILHRARWHWQVERKDHGFKINNSWGAPLARWFVARNPDAAGFFEMRESRTKAAPIRVYVDATGVYPGCAS